LSATDRIQNLELDRQIKHAVQTFAYPSQGGTAYGARCPWCGDTWSYRDREVAKRRLETFRAEECFYERREG
jgi:hypothetical protein